MHATPGEIKPPHVHRVLYAAAQSGDLAVTCVENDNGLALRKIMVPCLVLFFHRLSTIEENN